MVQPMTRDVDDRLIWMLKVSRTMLATRDLDPLLALVTDAFVEASEADRGVLLLHNPSSGDLERRVARNSDGTHTDKSELQISTIAHQVFREQKPVFATDTGAANDLAARRSVDELQLKMMVCVPLKTENEVFGVIYADGKTSLDRVFTNTNQSTLEMLADHAAAAIENARLFERTTNDPLTGLPNNSFFTLELAKTLRDASAEQPIGVLLVDIDAFRRVNRAAGTEGGNLALIDLARTIEDVATADGLVARYGSDKFALLLRPDEESIDLRLRDVAERIRAAIAAKHYHGVEMSCGIGGVKFPHAAVETSAELLSLADDALARARSRGKSEVEIV